MAYGELYIPPIYIANHVNPVNGQFQKGHVPANKGKKWSDYMGKRAQKRVIKSWLNNVCAKRHQGKGSRPDVVGYCGKKVIAINDEGTWVVFPTVAHAANYFGVIRRNVSRCAALNEAKAVNKRTGKINTDHRYQGIRFYFETDDIWTTKIMSNK